MASGLGVGGRRGLQAWETPIRTLPPVEKPLNWLTACAKKNRVFKIHLDVDPKGTEKFN